MLSHKSFDNLKYEFNLQENILSELVILLKSFLILCEGELDGKSFKNSIRKQCLKKIKINRRKVKDLLLIKNQSLKNLNNLVEDLPGEYKKLIVFEDFPDNLEDYYLHIYDSFFGSRVGEPSLEKLLSNNFFDVRIFFQKTKDLSLYIQLAKAFLIKFETNLFSQENKILDLKFKVESLKINFEGILKSNKIYDLNNLNFIFDTNFLIFLEERRLKFNKKKYDFIFPETFKLLLFKRLFNESKSGWFFNKKGNINHLIQYLKSLNYSEEIIIKRNQDLSDEIIQTWYQSGNGNSKQLGKFVRGFDIEIIQFILENPNKKIVLFAKDSDIEKTVKLFKQRNKFKNVIIIDFDYNSKDIKFERIA